MTTATPHLTRTRGNVYFRHPVTRTYTPLPRDESSQAFRDAYAPLLAAVTRPKPPRPVAEDAVSKQPGTIAFFCVEWAMSDAFKAMSESTRRNYKRIMESVRGHTIGGAMLHDMTPRLLDLYTSEIARTHASTTADQHATLISNLWGFARRYECFERGDKHNPAIGRLRHHEPDDEGHLAWPCDVIDKFDGYAEPYLRAYRMGLHYTGQRGGDVLNMMWEDYTRGKIFVVQEKTGAKVWIACPKPLREMLDRMKAKATSDHIFVNKWGRPYTSSDGLSKALANHLKFCDFTGYSMHGLRKNAGTELALAGCTVPQIMAVLGHKTERMALFYVRQADKIRLAEQATAKWDTHIEQEASRRVEEREEAVIMRRRALRAV
jgi:integrase